MAWGDWGGAALLTQDQWGPRRPRAPDTLLCVRGPCSLRYCRLFLPPVASSSGGSDSDQWWLSVKVFTQHLSLCFTDAEATLTMCCPFTS